MSAKTSLMQIWAMARKDFTVWESYRSQVLVALLSIAFSLFSWAILGSYSNQSVPEYNTNFISFLVVGVITSGFVLPLSQGTRINPWTFETVLMSGMRKSVIVVGSLLWQTIFAAITLIPQVLLAIFLFRVEFVVNFLSLFIAVLISMTLVVSLAMMDMGIRIVTKQSDPIIWGIILVSGIGSGLLYPIQELDKYVPGISNFSWALPFTWIYHLIRVSVLEGGSILDPNVALSFAGAILYCAAVIVVSYYIMSWGLKRAKKDGTLGWY